MWRVDFHTHTLASGHAFNTLQEMARAARACEIAALGVTDHGPSMEGAPTPGYFEMVGRVPPEIEGVQILMGCEANITDLDGNIDLGKALAAEQRVLIVGLHRRTPYPTSTTKAENTQAILRALGRQRPHIVSHPYRPDFPTDVVALAEAACDQGVLLEVNLALFRDLLPSNSPAARDETIIQTRVMIDRLRRRGSGFVLNSDAHTASELPWDKALVDQLQSLLEFAPSDILNLSRPALERYLQLPASKGKG